MRTGGFVKVPLTVIPDLPATLKPWPVKRLRAHHGFHPLYVLAYGSQAKPQPLAQFSAEFIARRSYDRYCFRLFADLHSFT
jgi:hypothetical protein